MTNEHGHDEYPEEVVRIVAPKPNKFKDMLNSFWGNTRKESKLNIAIGCLQIT